MLELVRNDPIIKAYLKDIHHLKDQLVAHELGRKAPFHNLLDKAAKKRGWTLVAEVSTYSGGKRVVPDGTVRDEFRLACGWWETKDTADKLASEIRRSSRPDTPPGISSSRTRKSPFSIRTAAKREYSLSASR
jgi:hypothetical protein